MNILVAGAGAWGTTIADILAEDEKNEISLWCHEKELCTIINTSHENTMYLSGFKINPKIFAVNDFEKVSEYDLIIMAVPSSFFKITTQEIRKYNPKGDFLVLTKGFELSSGQLLTDILSENLKSEKIRIAALSGPNLATEISQRKPASAVIASKDKEFAEKLQGLFFRDFFRIYISDDINGVQIGGAFKNIIAIGAGVSDALGFGINTKAAYLTRGIMEMTRFGVENGANPYTFSGLAGTGDLIATANSELSRNYSFGKALVESGKTPQELLEGQTKAIEGVLACKAVLEKAKEYGIEVPITETVYNMIYGNIKPEQAVCNLMQRNPKSEIY